MPATRGPVSSTRGRTPRLPETHPAFRRLTFEFWKSRMRSSYESPPLWNDVTGINSNISLIGVVPKEKRFFSESFKQ